jgi:hypothetical protein
VKLTRLLPRLSVLSLSKCCAICVYAVYVALLPDVSATILVAMSTNDRCIIGADGRSIDPEGEVRRACKIRVATNCLFAVSGLASESITRYSVDKLVRHVCAEPGTLDDHARSADHSIRAPLGNAIVSLAANHPQFYRMRLENRPILELMLISNKLSAVNVIVLSYKYEIDRVELQKTARLPGPQGNNLLICGEKQPARFYLQRHKEPDVFSRPVQFVRELMRQTLAAYPDEVGPPFTLLTISKTGFKWSSLGACTLDEVNGQ